MFHKTKPYVNIKCKIAHEKKLTKTLSETNPKIWIIPGTWVKRLLFYFIIFNHIKKTDWNLVRNLIQNLNYPRAVSLKSSIIIHFLNLWNIIYKYIQSWVDNLKIVIRYWFQKLYLVT